MIEELKKKEKKFTRRIWITWICGIITTFVFAFLYFKFEKSIFALFFVITFFAFSVTATVFEVKRITIDAKFMWYNYKTNQSLSSGVMLIITIFVLPVTYLAVMLKFVPDDWKSVVQSILSCLIAAFPAFLSLLGVHYSNTIHQISRAKEIQGINKPYPSIEIEYRITGDLEEDKHILKLLMIVSNLANNVLIPLSISYNNKIIPLEYYPINEKIKWNYDVDPIEIYEYPQKTEFEFRFIYKDSLENKYENEFVINVNNNKGKVVARLFEARQIYD